MPVEQCHMMEEDIHCTKPASYKVVLRGYEAKLYERPQPWQTYVCIYHSSVYAAEQYKLVEIK